VSDERNVYVSARVRVLERKRADGKGCVWVDDGHNVGCGTRTNKGQRGEECVIWEEHAST
jgi:hypothetical protein